MSEYRALLSIHRALLSMHTTLLKICVGLCSITHACVTACARAEQGSFVYT